MWQTSTVAHMLIEVGDHWLDPMEICAVRAGAGDNRVWVMLANGETVIVQMPPSGDPVQSFMRVISDSLSKR